MDIYITTARRADPISLATAQETAARLGGTYVARQNISLAALREKFAVPAVVVAKGERLVLNHAGGDFFFHPSMAHLRLKNLRQGKSDHLVEALALSPGMSVLDCTLGLGADAIVASFAVGETGAVTALEHSSLVAAAVANGLARHGGEHPATIAAMRRIKVVCADYLDYLAAQPDKSVDVIYFDPMFRQPVAGSVALDPLRELADKRPLSAAAVAEARRVARRRVVMKEAFFSREFARLGFERIVGGKYSRIKYGIMLV